METTPAIPPLTFVIILSLAVLIALVAGYAARMLEEKPHNETPAAEAETPKEVLPEEHVALRVTLDKSLQWHWK